MTEKVYVTTLLQLLTIMFYSYLFHTTYFHNKDELNKKEKVILLAILLSGYVITSALAWILPSFLASCGIL